MTKEQFEIFWISNYPGAFPMPHYFENDYRERWFRIHSLPGSKRYADTDDEWETLLARQNNIITDVLGNNAPILFLTGDFSSEGGTELHPLNSVNSISDFQMIPLPTIDLYKIAPEHYDKGQYYNPVFCEETWQPKKFDNILRDIAEDQLKAMFISIERKFIIAPYDGGIDIVLDNKATRDHYKVKYKTWLSTRPDGL
jgi:hypothetical protein